MKYAKIIFSFLILGLFAYIIYSGPKPENTGDMSNGGRVMAPQYITIPVGETKDIFDLSITLNSVVNDYRCPIDAKCIEAGAVNINATFASNGEKLTANYSSDGVPLSIFGYNVSIVQVSPDLYSGKEINPRDYEISFFVESALSGVVDNPNYSGDVAGGTVPAGDNGCVSMGGEWDSLNGECLGVDANICQEIGGEWNDCASACRNDPKAEVCTMQCVQVCSVD